MSSKLTIINAIRSRVLAQVVTPQSLGSVTAWPNAAFTQPAPGAGVKWVRVTILLGETRQASTGGSTNFHRTPGVLTFGLFQPIDTGDSIVMTLADVIVPKFRSLSADGVVYHSPAVVPVGRTEQWYQVNVDCPFFFDEQV